MSSLMQFAVLAATLASLVLLVVACVASTVG